MIKSSIIIIGAGAAGLMAAKKLAPQFKVTILEAASHIGGRIHSIIQNGNIIEAGAEFVHGNLPVTLALLQEANIAIVKTEGQIYRKKNGGFISTDEMTEQWSDLLKKMKSVKEDITLHHFLKKFYPGADHEMFRRHVISFAEGFDVADITKVSVKALYKEWNTEDYNNFRITGGYGALIKYLEHLALAGSTNIHTNCQIKKVQWQRGTVTVHATNGEKYNADKLLVTVPLSLLQQPASKAFFNFKPSLPFNENTAAGIGFGAVIKVVLEFKQSFWQLDAGFILSDEVFPTWWTQLPNTIPILTGWLGGPRASIFSNEIDDVIIEKAMTSLGAIYDIPVEKLNVELSNAMVFNWQKNEYALGAYSYSTVQAGEAKKTMMTPIANTIFFAGEALYTGDHPGTVEAAFVSAINVTDKIKGLFT